MPKGAASTLVWQGEQHAYHLYQGDEYLLEADSSAWFDWLSEHQSFAFQGQAGHLNALKEARARGNGYWYAYQRHGQRMRKKYLGPDNHLSVAHLEAVATSLNASENTSLLASEKPIEALLDQREQLSSPARSSPLLAPKIQLPRLHSELVTRTRLLALLDRGLESKLTLVTAPAGFGKTTVVRQWIAKRTDSQTFAWVSLDEEDNDPFRFWHYIFSACQAVLPTINPEIIASLYTVDHSSFQASFLLTVLKDWLNDLTQMNRSLAIILEDYHHIHAQQVHESLIFLLDHLPINVHFLLMSRTDPPLPLARLRAQNELREIQTLDLRFSEQEMHTFLQQALNYTPSEQMSKQLIKKLEGWATGLRLLVLSLQRMKDPQQIEEALKHFPASERSLQNYFVDEILMLQTEEIQAFLLQTSILERLNASLCEWVTENARSAYFLDRLDRENLFLERLDGPGDWYRYHALFAQAMQQEAIWCFGSVRIQQLTLQASEWYEEHTFFREAIDMALQAKSYKRAADLIEQRIIQDEFHVGGIGFFMQDIYTLHRWVEALPSELLSQYPHICLAHATVLVFLFALDHAPTLQMAEDAWLKANRTDKLGEVYAVRSLITRHLGSLHEALKHAKIALAYLPEEQKSWRSVAMSMLSVGEFYNGHLEAAAEGFQKARTLSIAAGSSGFTRAYMAQMCDITIEQGKLRLAAEVLRQVDKEAREQQDNDDIARVFQGFATLTYTWNDLQMCSEHVAMGLAISFNMSDEEFGVSLMLLQTRLLHLQGKDDLVQQKYAAILSQLQQSPASFVNQRMRREVLYEQARVAIALGNLQDFQRCWYERNQYNDEQSYFAQQREQFLFIRFLLQTGKQAEALLLAIEAKEKAQQAGHEFLLWESLLLLTCIYLASKRRDEALACLRTVVERTYTESPIRIFLDAGQEIEGLFPDLHFSHKLINNYVGRIVQAFAQAKGATFAIEREHISAQEMRVLRLLANGKSNPEIARELVVSVNTVRTQVQSIYRKLNVSNRVAASEYARQHGFI